MLGLGASQEKQGIWTFIEISYRSVAIKWNSWKLLQGPHSKIHLQATKRTDVSIQLQVLSSRASRQKGSEKTEVRVHLEAEVCMCPRAEGAHRRVGLGGLLGYLPQG